MSLRPAARNGSEGRLTKAQQREEIERRWKDRRRCSPDELQVRVPRGAVWRVKDWIEMNAEQAAVLRRLRLVGQHRKDLVALEKAIRAVVVSPQAKRLARAGLLGSRLDTALAGCLAVVADAARENENTSAMAEPGVLGAVRDAATVSDVKRSAQAFLAGRERPANKKAGESEIGIRALRQVVPVDGPPLRNQEAADILNWLEFARVTTLSARAIQDSRRRAQRRLQHV